MFSKAAVVFWELGHSSPLATKTIKMDCFGFYLIKTDIVKMMAGIPQRDRRAGRPQREGAKEVCKQVKTWGFLKPMLSLLDEHIVFGALKRGEA